MTRFTKATLIVATLVLAATAYMVGKVYIVRCGFNVGGKWLVPAVGAVARSDNCEIYALR